MYGIKFTIDCKNVKFQNFAISYDTDLDFSGSGILTLHDFDNILNQDLLNKEDFINLIIQEYFSNFDYEDIIHFNQDDIDKVYNAYVKECNV